MESNQRIDTRAGDDPQELNETRREPVETGRDGGTAMDRSDGMEMDRVSNEGSGREATSTSELLTRQEGQSTSEMAESGRKMSDGHTDEGSSEEPLVEDAGKLNERWNTLQVRFVDEPKDAVREADGLVAEVIQKLTERFAEERDGLEKQWQSGSDVSTEDLRLALRHYRSFFQRLLAA